MYVLYVHSFHGLCTHTLQVHTVCVLYSTHTYIYMQLLFIHTSIGNLASMVYPYKKRVHTVYLFFAVLYRLLQFVTGSSQLPSKGFSELNPKFQISHAPVPGRLPSAHTWYVYMYVVVHDIDLPGVGERGISVPLIHKE